MKSVKRIAVILSLVMLVACCGVLLTACNTEPQAESYVAMDINPSIELTLDRQNKVISVRAMNEDAQVMLYEAKGIVGADVEDAAAVIAELAATYNYVTENNSNISVTVAGKNAEAELAIFNDIDKSFTASLKLSGIDVTLSDVGGVLINRELEKVKSQYPDNASVQALTVGKYRLVKSAMLADRTLTVETASAMSVEKLSNVVKETHKYYADKISDAFERVYEEAELIYEQGKQLLLSGVYLTIDPLNLELQANATKLIALQTAYFTLEKIDEIDAKAQEFFSKEQVKEFCAKLGMAAEEAKQFAEKVCNQAGEATEDAIEYALERMMDNMTEEQRQAFEGKLDAAEEYLEQVEEELKQLGGELKTQALAAVETIKAFLNTAFDFENIDDLEDVIDIIEDKIEDTEKWLEGNMTKEQKDTLAKRQKALSSQIAELEKAFKQTVESARAEAKAWIEQQREIRLSITVK
ncbi:MAG: hypothetical protein NC350_01125 [Corallococcus sp.]|nr:hypothetical protein [Corallococcus sp.]